MPRPRRARLLIPTLLACSVASAWPASAADAPDVRPSVRAVWTATPPVVDGDPSDPAWAEAPVGAGFVERKPSLRAEPDDQTTFRVVFDSEALYFLIDMRDSEPGAILGKTLTRDSFSLFSDDAISIKLDPRSDHRTTYGFAVNPSGARLDYRAINEGAFKVEVDYVWQGTAQVTETGWVVEARISYSALGIDPASPPARLGLNLSRDHPRRNATYDWSLMPPPYSPVAASRYGDLVGLDELPARLVETGAEASTLRRWYVRPYALGGFSRARPQGGGIRTAPEYNGGVDGGLDFGDWQVDLTVHTDFAQVDLDDRVVNLSRFGLFIPEKRDFFLSGVELFSAGREQTLQLLHTRTIGLAGDREIPILAGLKLRGRPTDDLRVGLLQVTTRPLGDAPWESHLVARGLYEIGAGSNLGVMLTHRQSLEQIEDHNVVVGLDGSWRSTSTPLLLDAFAAASIDPGAPADDGSFADDEARLSGGLDLVWRGELVRPRLTWLFVEPDFTSDLGFVRRTDLQSGRATLEVEPRTDAFGLEKIRFQVTGGLLADAAASRLLDWDLSASTTITWALGLSARIEAVWGSETVTDSFEVGEGTVIDPGRYEGTYYALSLSTPGAWIVSASADLSTQDYLGGRLYGAGGSLTIRPIPQLRLEANGRFDDVSFDDGRKGFQSALLNARLSIGFTTDIGLSQTIGWSHLERALHLQTRLRWTYLPGSDLFLVYQLDLGLDPLVEDYQSLLLKATFHTPWE